MAKENVAQESNGKKLKQMGIVFNELAALAEVISELACGIIEDGAENFEASKVVAIRQLALQAGFLADFGGKKSGSYLLRGDASQWLLCPAFHSAASEVPNV